MSQQPKIIETQPFKLFPLQKDAFYGYYASSPSLQFEFNENFQRMIDSRSLRLNGKLRIYSRDGSVMPLPANRFDQLCTGTTAGAEPQQANEYVCYVNERVSASSTFHQIDISNMMGNLFEQFKDFNRSMASQIPVTSSYKDLSCHYQNTYAAYPNNDCMSRACSSDIPFAVKLRTGYIDSIPSLSLANGGIKLSITLANTAQVVFGLNADDGNFVYELRDVFLTGKYQVLEEPIKPENQQTEYSSYYSYLSVLNSANDHTNSNLQLSQVTSIYMNNAPAAWQTNYAYDSFATPKLLELNAGGTDYDEKEMKEVTFNKGSVRFPYMYNLNFEKSNAAGSYQALRSRTFLNSVYNYSGNINSLISPYTENVTSMVEQRSDALKTPQHPDQGMVKRWKWNKASAWSRDGAVESAGNVHGIGLRLDNLYIGEFANYKNSSFNFNIKSDIDSTVNNCNIFCLANTMIFLDANGNLTAAN